MERIGTSWSIASLIPPGVANESGKQAALRRTEAGALPLELGQNTAISIPERGPRHMKGQQVATALYLSPGIYWELKALSRRSGTPIQCIVRAAIVEWLAKQPPRV